MKHLLVASLLILLGPSLSASLIPPLKVDILDAQERKRLRKPVSVSEAEGRRFSPGWLKAHRHRLGLAAADYAELVGVSPQTIYNWEHGRSKPRKEQLAALAAIRRIGKREAQRRLE